MRRLRGNEGEDRQKHFIENDELCLPSNLTTRFFFFFFFFFFFL